MQDGKRLFVFTRVDQILDFAPGLWICHKLTEVRNAKQTGVWINVRLKNGPEDPGPKIGQTFATVFAARFAEVASVSLTDCYFAVVSTYQYRATRTPGIARTPIQLTWQRGGRRVHAVLRRRPNIVPSTDSLLKRQQYAISGALTNRHK